MKETKTRNCNGEGSTYYTIQKIKRKKFLEEECSICKNCTNRTACNNRVGYDKCDKCKNCKEECLNYCDHFYCRGIWQSQITVDGQQITVANQKKKKDSVEKKKDKEAKILTKQYVKKNGITLEQKILKIYDIKLKTQSISESTYRRMLHDLKHIQAAEINYIPMQELTTEQLQDFINSKIYMNQRSIDSILQLLKIAFYTTIKDKEIADMENPILDVIVPYSTQKKEPVTAFEVYEEINLINYIKTNTSSLITSKCTKYDSITIKNIILLGLATGFRIGELGALDYTKHIDFNKKIITVERTLSTDKNDKIVMGTLTKTGRVKQRQHKDDSRYIPFQIFDESEITKILKEQIEISQNNINNKENLLFCRNDGSYIDHKQLNTIFKKICRNASIKLDLVKGCHFHMLRHTFTTRCIEAGMDLIVLSKLLGHADTKQIEKTYGHILNRYFDENLLKLQNYYSNNNFFNQSLKLNNKKLIS